MRHREGRGRELIEKAPPTNGAGHLPPRRLLAYALIELPVGGAMNVTSLFLGFHYASLGISLTQIGAILMIARLLDVLIDPAVGLLSDRTRRCDRSCAPDRNLGGA